MWSESTDEQARGSLRLALNNLRKQLGKDVIFADREWVQLNSVFPLWLDVREFQRATNQQVQIAESHVSIRPLLFAISQYAKLLPDFYDAWIAAPREELRTLFLDSALQLIDHLRASTEYKTATEVARKVLSVDRANEAAHQHLMFCFSILGDRAAALNQYEFCKRALHDELGIEPADATRALYETIRKQTETKSDAARLTNLPRPTTSFVGRERDLQQLGTLFV